MKWLLPEPNEPAQERAPADPRRQASATRPSAGSNASTSAGVTTYSSIVAAIRVCVDAVGQPQHVVLVAGASGNIEDVAQQHAHCGTCPSHAGLRPRPDGAGRQAASSAGVFPTWAARWSSCSRQNAARLTP